MVQRLFALGSNGSGQLGLGHSEDVSSPTLVKLPYDLESDRIVNIASGGNHTLLLTSSGSVYVAGNSEDGRCLLKGDQSDLTTFVKLDLPFKVKLCAATWSASLLVTDDDHILVFGKGERGELGLGEDRKQVSSPERLTLGVARREEITALSACMSHCAATLTNGDVYAWGNGKQGQCGDAGGVVWRPTLVRTQNSSPASAICGKDFTVLLPKVSSSDISIIGLAKRDRFGLKAALIGTPATVSNAVATWGSILAIDGSKRLKGWGRNDHGQLGPGTLTDLVDLRAGSEHVVTLTQSGQVVTWGWGEHGNCGLPVDEQCDVKGGRFNVLEVPGRVSLIGAGCATTFVVSDVP